MRLFNEYNAMNEQTDLIVCQTDELCKKIIDYCNTRNLDLRDASLVMTHCILNSFAEEILRKAMHTKNL